MIGISAGNHAQALAWGAALEGIDCLVVMYASASPAKVAATRGYGAAVDLEAADAVEAFERLDEHIRETGRTLVHPFDDPLVIAGQGTLALELLEDAPEVETIVVPVGGGGLVAGIAAAAPDRRVVAVEPEGSTAVHDALAAGRPVPVTPVSIADGLSGAVRRRAGARGSCGEGVESVLVSEEEIEDGVSASSTSAPSSPASRPARSASPRSWRARSERPDRRCCLGWKRGRRNRLCYPGPAMKAGIHPEYVSHARPLLLRQRVRDPLDAGGDPRRRLLGLPPVLHGQAEADGLRRPGRALPAPAGKGRRRPPRRLTSPGLLLTRQTQQHRGPGSPGGRDDAQPFEVGCRRPQARRRDRRGRQGHQLADGAPPDLPPAGRSAA